MNALRNSHSFRSTQPLTEDDIRRVAPSVFAAEAHGSRSARYTYVPTVEVLKGLRAEGFLPYAVAQSRTRDESRREFTKHMLRLRKGDAMTEVGQETPEIVLLNSHDGTSSYQMMAGMFRLVCKNGMVAPAGMTEEIRIPHSGDIVGRVIEGAFTVVGEFDRVVESSETMKALTLSDGEARAFGQAALVAKFGEQDAYPVTVEQALESRRSADDGADLWRTFNRVQENLVRGGLRYRTENGRRQRTRAVQGITANVALNRALWTLADQMARLKAA